VQVTLYYCKKTSSARRSVAEKAMQEIDLVAATRPHPHPATEKEPSLQHPIAGVCQQSLTCGMGDIDIESFLSFSTHLGPTLSSLRTYTVFAGAFLCMLKAF